MNKKVITLLILLIAVISIASACAVELTKENDFDGFKMKVNESDNFTNLSESDKFSGLAGSNAVYKNDDNSIFVFVYGNDLKKSIFYLTGGSIDFDYYKGTDLVKTEENLAIFDGNLNVFNQTSDNLNVNLTKFAGVGNGAGNLSVIVAGTDGDLVKDYAKTIKFE